ncbi:MAG: NrtA/SsuA/CpmA family ABC transporter substrate-binding protein [Rhizomicrobium sp.]
MRTRSWILLAVLGVLLVIGAIRFWPQSQSDSQQTVRYGITPFQDSALPVVPAKLGWYKDDGVDVRLVDLGWGDVPLALASGSIDVALYNFDSYQAALPSLKAGGKDIVFYAPLYVWNGAAIMVHPGAMQTGGDLSHLSKDAKLARVKILMEQLRGKRIGVTEGTTFEQTVLDALRAAGMDPKHDVQLVNARPEDNLAAFISGDLDAFSGGLTERVQAKRHGAVELLVGPDVSLPVVDGIVARKDFVDSHPELMRKLVDSWFRTIQYISADIPGRSSVLRDYLRGKASVDYTANEYAIAWTFQYFPKTRSEASDAFLKPGTYYWQPIWAETSNFLVKQGKIKSSVPEGEFQGTTTLPPR